MKNISGFIELPSEQIKTMASRWIVEFDKGLENLVEKSSEDFALWSLYYRKSIDGWKEIPLSLINASNEAPTLLISIETLSFLQKLPTQFKAFPSWKTIYCD